MKRKHKIVVSFTTISHRIRYIYPMVMSLFEQNLKPDEIYLWISKEPFNLDNGIAENDIPEEIKDLTDDNRIAFKIEYTENIAGYRKLLPVLEKYKKDHNVVIITADDDTLYPANWIKRLYKQFLKDDCVITYRARKIRRKPDGKLASYKEWPSLSSYENRKDLYLCPIGKDGILYSPKFFNENIFDRAFRRLSPTRADIWFAAAAISNNVMTRHLPTLKKLPWKKKNKRKTFPQLPNVDTKSSDWPELYKYNMDRNDTYINNVFHYFSI